MKSKDAYNLTRDAARLVERLVKMGAVADSKIAREQVLMLATWMLARDRKLAASYAHAAEVHAAKFGPAPECRDTVRGLKLVAGALRAFAAFSADPALSAFRGQAKRDQKGLR